MQHKAFGVEYKNRPCMNNVRSHPKFSRYKSVSHSWRGAIVSDDDQIGGRTEINARDHGIKSGKKLDTGNKPARWMNYTAMGLCNPGKVSKNTWTQKKIMNIIKKG